MHAMGGGAPSVCAPTHGDGRGLGVELRRAGARSRSFAPVPLGSLWLGLCVGARADAELYASTWSGSAEGEGMELR